MVLCSHQYTTFHPTADQTYSASLTLVIFFMYLDYCHTFTGAVSITSDMVIILVI